MKKLLTLLLICALIIGVVGCGGKTESTEPQGSAEPADVEDTKVDFSRLRIVIGSTSTGGDTYENAEAIARFLEEPLGVNAKVDAVGAGRAFNELEKAPKDGSTVMFFHDMTYLGVEFGSYDAKYALENWEIGPMVSENPGNAFLAKHDAPYNTMAEAAEWLKNNPNEKITIAIEAGGVSEISFHAFYLWVKDTYGEDVANRIKVYVTGSQSEKDQALWDGNVEIIHGSMGANAQYTDEGVDEQIRMKFLGVTSAERIPGFEDVPTFAEMGITFDGKPFVFTKEFFFLLPKDVDPVFAEKLDKAVAKIMAEQPDYEEMLNVRTYLKNHKPAADAKEYIYEKRASIQKMIEMAPDLDDLVN